MKSVSGNEDALGENKNTSNVQKEKIVSNNQNENTFSEQKTVSFLTANSVDGLFQFLLTDVNSDSETETKKEILEEKDQSDDDNIPSRRENFNDGTRANIPDDKNNEKICYNLELDDKKAKTEGISQRIVASDIPLQMEPFREVPSDTTQNSERVTSEESTAETTTPPTPLITLEEYEKVYREYLLIAEHKTENTNTLMAKYNVIHGRFSNALINLQIIVYSKTTSAEYLPTEKAVIQILEKLG